MKKITLLKKGLFAASALALTAASCHSLLAQTDESFQNASVYAENSASPQVNIPIPGVDDNTIYLALTPDGAVASSDTLEVKKGEDFWIKGKVTPDLGYDFKYVDLNWERKDYTFWSIIQLKSHNRQTNSNFTYKFRANYTGKQRLSFNVEWADGSNKHVKKDVCPLTIIVK
jgi:hypothetical protein